MKILEIRVTRKRCVYCAADVMAAAFVALLLLCMDCVPRALPFLSLPCPSCVVRMYVLYTIRLVGLVVVVCRCYMQ